MKLLQKIWSGIRILLHWLSMAVVALLLLPIWIYQKAQTPQP